MGVRLQSRSGLILNRPQHGMPRMPPVMLHSIGKEIAQRAVAHDAPEKGTGWHRHEAVAHIVERLRGPAPGFQNSTSSSSIASGSRFAASIHSTICGSAMMVSQ